jgi:hypothetical protein
MQGKASGNGRCFALFALFVLWLVCRSARLARLASAEKASDSGDLRLKAANRWPASLLGGASGDCSLQALPSSATLSREWFL